MASKLVPVVERIDAEFFGRLPDSDKQSLIHILSNLAEANHE